MSLIVRTNLAILDTAAVKVNNVPVPQRAHKFDLGKEIVHRTLIHVAHCLLQALHRHL